MLPTTRLYWGLNCFNIDVHKSWSISTVFSIDCERNKPHTYRPVYTWYMYKFLYKWYRYIP